jgi:hypothetical protein
MTAGRWVPGWTETHTQALDPLDFEPLPEPKPFRSAWSLYEEHRDDVASGEVWPDCPHCGSSNVDGGVTGLDLCEDCGGLSRDGEILAPPARRHRHSSDDRGMDPGLFC